MRNIPIVVLLIFTLLIPYPSLMAEGAEGYKCLKSGSDVWDSVKRVLGQGYKIDSVCGTPIVGLYEVVVNGKHIIYVAPGSKTIVVGSLIQDRQDLTKKRYMELVKKGAKERGESQDTPLPLKEVVLPSAGLTLPVVWGDLGRQMVEAGVIDKKKLEAIYSQRGGLTDEDKRLIYGSGNGKLKITLRNRNLVLNLLWALGLSNKNDILRKGPMMSRSFKAAARFASTGGWTISQGKPMDHYSRHKFLELDKEQQALVERVSRNIYRPCCNNPTYFPDCNHGMAMLGLLELMASQGLGEEDMYRIALKVNSYWFPTTYLTIAQWFKDKGIEWKDVKAEEVLGFKYSSASGFRQILTQVKPPQGRGESCGV